MWIADPFTDSGIGQVVLAASGVVTAGVVLWKPLRGLTRIVRSIRQFLDDWHGAPAREADGIPERPGVLKRIGHVEHLLNGGGLGAKIDKHLEEAAGHYAELTGKQDEIVARLDVLTEDVRDARELAVDTAVTAASAIRQIDDKVTRELRETRAEAEGLRASLYESLQVDNLGDD